MQSTPPAPQPSRTAGARRRRRHLYGPPPRLTPTSPLTGRLLWAIGDWGRASEHIGTRWEAVCAEIMFASLEENSGFVVLGAEPALMAEVLGSGLPHADALRTSVVEGRLALEPLDFKWSLETASVRQVSPETLEQVLAAGLPRLEGALAEQRQALGLPADAEIQPQAGRFLAPVHPANYAALRDDPDLPSTLLPVDAHAFFEPLPGWPAAVALARLEGGDLRRVSAIDSVDRYYRLGAGVHGALVRLATGLFDDEAATVDAPAEIAALQRRGRARTINALLLYLEQRQAARRALEERVTAIARTAYPFARLRADFTRWKAPRELVESRGALGRAHGEVGRAVTTAVRAEGRRLVAAGSSEEQAVEQLAAEAPRWEAVARERARMLARSASPAVVLTEE